MAERQLHGFTYQQDIIDRYHMEESDNYTSPWDGQYNNTPVSIKTEKFGSDIEMADFFRNAINTETFYLIVGFWNGDKNNIVEERFLLINGEEWHTLFDCSFIDKFHFLLNNITNDHSDDLKWRNEITKLRREWSAATPNLVRPRFKRDHDKQKRIQCAINNGDFYNYFCKKYEIEL